MHVYEMATQAYSVVRRWWVCGWWLVVLNDPSAGVVGARIRQAK